MFNITDDESFTTEALGRPFTLGALYDGRRDQLITDHSLWDDKDLSQYTKDLLYYKTSFSVTSADSFTDKCDNLHVNNQLRLSVLSGLVHLSDLGQYLVERRPSNKSDHLALTFHLTTSVKELDLKQLTSGNVNWTDYYGDQEATHFVSGIEYGVSAVFVFDCLASQLEELKMELNKLGRLLIQPTSFSSPFDSNEFGELKQLTCHFFSDFPIETQPKTLEKAVELYMKLPSLLGENFQHAVAKSVRLSPLSCLDGGAECVCRPVRVSLVNSIVELFEQLVEGKFACQNYLERDLCKDEQVVGTNLLVMRGYLDECVSMLVKQLKSIVPAIRAGQQPEKNLLAIVQLHNRSPLNENAVNKFIEYCRIEIAVIEGSLQLLQSVDVQKYKAAELTGLSLEVKNPLIVLLIKITRPGRNNYLQDVRHYVRQTAGYIGTEKVYDACSLSAANNFGCVMKQSERLKTLKRLNPTKNQYAVSVDYGENDVVETSFVVVRNIDHEPFDPPPSTSRPPVVSKVGPTSLIINFPQASAEGSFDFYNLLFRPAGNDSWDCLKSVPKTDRFCTIDQLLPETHYEVAVQLASKYGVSKISELVPVVTRWKLSSSLLSCSPKLPTPAKSYSGPVQYQPPMVEVYCDATEKVRRFCIGPQATEIDGGRIEWDQVCQLKMSGEKVVLLVGATDSAKSTLLNHFTNYLLGVQSNDEHQFLLVTTTSESRTQTNEFVTAYSFPVLRDCPVPYAVTLVDTPGFGDIETFDQDGMLFKKIRHLFSIQSGDGIAHLNAVIFMAESRTGNLTQSIKLVYNRVLSIFDKVDCENIELLIAPCDGQDSPILEAVENYNDFVEGSQQSKNQAADFCQNFLMLERQSLEEFFVRLAHLPCRSMVLSNELLNERDRLESTAQRLQESIQEVLTECEGVIDLRTNVRQHQHEINGNNDFDIEIIVQEVVHKTLKLSEFATICLQCNWTCHYPCNHHFVYTCSAMRWGPWASAICTQCPGQCNYLEHKICTYSLGLVERKKSETVKTVLERYNIALDEKNRAEDLLKCICLHVEGLMWKAIEQLRSLQVCLKRLNEILLRANPMSPINYLEMLIKSEQFERKPGYKERVDCLQDIKEKAELIEHTRDVSFNPLQDFVERQKAEHNNRDARRVLTLLVKDKTTSKEQAKLIAEEKMTLGGNSPDVEEPVGEASFCKGNLSINSPTLSSSTLNSPVEPFVSTEDFVKEVGDNWFPNKQQLKEIKTGKFAIDSSDKVIMSMSCGQAYDLRPNVADGRTGHCMIMNQSIRREGSRHDVNCIKELIETQLAMSVEVIDNVSTDVFKKRLEEWIESDEVNYCGCFILFLMAHGHGNSLEMDDGTTLDLETDVLQVLGSAKTTRKKPKLVFVESCESSDYDCGLESDSANQRIKPSKHTPTMNEMFLLRSTHMPISAKRHTRYGTLFIQAWCEVVKRCAYNTDLDEIRQRITALMSRTAIDDAMQMSSLRYNTLTRKFYFPSRDWISRKIERGSLIYP